MNIAWQGQGIQEQGIDTVTNKIIVKIDPQYFRPSEVDTLLGDATKARTILGWTPSYSFQELVWEMCEHAVKESQHP
jgi:GDPmannose 4,6-dehydratase